MTDAHVPTFRVAVKLASIAIHADELLSPDGRQVDASTINALLADAEVVAYLDELRALALLPVKRSG